jgi:hypothetical protein
VNVSGEPTKERISPTRHFYERWSERIGPNDTQLFINDTLENISRVGERVDMDERHYKLIYNNIVVVVKKLSPLHSLTKTVYTLDMDGLDGID